ncbi:hypothetical protein BH09DEP1_BH09DEP1_4700 [soil metagenome]
MVFNMKKSIVFIFMFFFFMSNLMTAQEKSSKNYFKPALKGVGAAACFFVAYSSGCSAFQSVELFSRASNMPYSNGFVSAVAQHQFAVGYKNVACEIFANSSLLCIGSGLLGGYLLTSAYKDFRRAKK